MGQRPSPSLAASPSGGVSNQHVRLSIGASSIPHPEKVDKGGEDAYFMTDDGKYLGDHLHLLLLVQPCKQCGTSLVLSKYT